MQDNVDIIWVLLNKDEPILAPVVTVNGCIEAPDAEDKIHTPQKATEPKSAEAVAASTVVTGKGRGRSYS